MQPPPYIALLGYGEAGSAFGRDLLALGARVRVHDPRVRPRDAVEVAADEADAVRGVDLVLSVNSASAALGALEAGAPGAREGAVWADMNTASPQAKTVLGETAARAGLSFADVAIMAPVPGRGLGVPMLVSGPAAERFAALLRPLGTPVTLQPGGAGAAARRKLLRSVFFKGMAAAVVEALDAARAAGCEEWLRENIAAELAGAGAGTVDRLVTGTRRHAGRRADEMAAAEEMVRGLGVEPAVARAARDLLLRIRAEEAGGPAAGRDTGEAAGPAEGGPRR
ncbi:NAD(P)-dependent oxidoreductase [Streptomyces xinghaiensis]|uniref:NAD(P)-dependent oxidoreductase n=1 Tax=Streptomyces xinghaiensis TaxID=1038928 RepID=UPI000BB0A979|nr:NAD(P)-dependent oxidoreductase [Streptomyces xinghaiensis]